MGTLYIFKKYTLCSKRNLTTFKGLCTYVHSEGSPVQVMAYVFLQG